MTHWDPVEFGIIRPTLLHLAVATLALGALYGATAHLATQAAAGREEAESTLVAVRSGYISSGQARQTFRTYEKRFQALREAGVINTEPRLAWTEAVQHSAKHLRLRGVTFVLEPSAPFAVEHPRVAAPLTASRMQLRFELVHEGELIEFLQRLRAVAPPLLWTRYCALERSAGTAQFLPENGNLRAECELVWITVHTTTPAPGDAP